MLYNTVLVSALQQSESAICIHIFPISPPLEPPSRTPYPTPLGDIKHRADLPVLCGSLPLAILHLVVYICQCYSLTTSLSPLPPCVLKSILYICVFIPALSLCLSVPFFKIPYICVSVRYLFYSF